MSTIDKIMMFPILGIPVCVYVFGGCLATLLGSFLYAVGSCLVELDRIREARQEWSKAKAERDEAFIKLMSTKR